MQSHLSVLVKSPPPRAPLSVYLCPSAKYISRFEPQMLSRPVLVKLFKQSAA